MTQGDVATLLAPMLGEGEKSPVASPGARHALPRRSEGPGTAARMRLHHEHTAGLAVGEREVQLEVTPRGRRRHPALPAHGQLPATVLDDFRRSPTALDDICSQ